MNFTKNNDDDYKIYIPPYVAILIWFFIIMSSITITNYCKQFPRDQHYLELNIKIEEKNPVPLYTHESNEVGISSYQTSKQFYNAVCETPSPKIAHLPTKIQPTSF